MKIYALLVFMLTLSTISGQHASIHGRVGDENNEALGGVIVQVKNGLIGDQTGEDGHYELEAPVGAIRLIFSRAGYSDIDTTVKVALTTTEIELDLQMQPFALKDPAVIVLDQRINDQAQALHLQRGAAQAVTVLQAESFNQYPDVSLAETIQHVPPTTMLRRYGEVDALQLRGLPATFTNISLNGEPLVNLKAEASKVTDLDLIQANLVDAIYINKGRTASMDADAIGGDIDFRIRQPEAKMELLFQGGLGGNFQSTDLGVLDRGIQQLSGVVNTELSEEKIIGLAAGHYFRNGSNNDERLIERGFNGTEGANIFRYRPTDTDRLAQKVGATGAIEIRPSIYTSLRLGYHYSRNDDEFIQRQATFDLDRNRELRETSNWEETRSINLITVKVKNNIERLKLDYGVSFAQNIERIDDRTRFRYETAIDDFSGIGTDPSAASTATSGELELRRFAFEKLKLNEDIAVGSANLTFFTNKSQNSFLKAGVRYRAKERRFGAFSDVVQLEQGADRVQSGTFGFQGEGIRSDALDNLNLNTDALANANPFDQENAFAGKERILGTYLSYRANWSGKLSSSFGLRYESTEVEYNSLNRLDSTKIDYGDLFPNLNLTYRLSKKQLLRFAYYQAIVRPTYSQLFPLDQLQSGNRSILRGNLAAAPVNSQNIDLAFESYGANNGMFSAAIYLKLLDDPLIQSAAYEEIADAPFIVNSLVNAQSATIAGLEVGLHQHLALISPAFRHFSIAANYNFNHSELESDLPNQDGLPMVGSPEQSGSLSLTYSNQQRGLSFVVAANYSGRTLIRLQDGAPIYREGLVRLDVSADVKLFKQLSCYGRLNNLTNPIIQEVREGSSTVAVDYASQQFGSWAVVGLRWQPNRKKSTSHQHSQASN